MAKRAEPPLGRVAEEYDCAFDLHLEVLPGLPPVECRRLERRLEDYAEAQNLRLDGTQLRHRVFADDRHVSVHDQVALIDWLVDQPGVVGVRIGPIVPLGHAQRDEGEALAFVHVRTGDFALIGLTLLYRCGRITPTLYLQILGGYVRQVH